jgi:hypothetical protein
MTVVGTDAKQRRHSMGKVSWRRRKAAGLAVGIFCVLGITACSSAQTDPYAGKDLKTLLPDQQSVIAKIDAGWAKELKPTEKKITSRPSKAASGSKCRAALGLMQSGGEVTEIAGESWSSDTGSEVLQLYRFATATDALAWKSAVTSVGKYCPGEYATEPHTAKMVAMSDRNTDSVGFSTHGGSAGRWDLVSVRGTLAIWVESLSSGSDAKELMVLASQRLAKAAS